MTIDPEKLEWCPCGSRIQPGKGYFCCRACFLSSAEFFRRKLNSPDQFKSAQARNQILLHAQRRGERREHNLLELKQSNRKEE